MQHVELYELLIIVGMLVFSASYFIAKVVFLGKAQRESTKSLIERIGILPKRLVKITSVHDDTWWTKLGAQLAPKNQKELDEIHRRLIKAGKKDTKYIGAFYFIRLSLMLGVGLVGILLWLLNLAPIYVALFGMAISYVIPERALDYLGAQRLVKISQSLPDFLDMVNVGINAGLGWMVAIKRVSEELKELHPEICYEFGFLQEQVQIGMSRIEALRQLAERNPIKDLEQLVNILIQNERMGSPVGESLDLFARRLYDEREEIMAEKAAKTSAKMALVIMPFLMVPYMVLFIGEKMVMLGRGF